MIYSRGPQGYPRPYFGKPSCLKEVAFLLRSRLLEATGELSLAEEVIDARPAPLVYQEVSTSCFKKRPHVLG